MERIKAIETKYRGYRFRSRLEARWAVFFDSLEIRYVYEPEGYDLGDGIQYLPDFFLPDSDVFFECKGVMTDIDKEKIRRLASATRKSVIVGENNLAFEVVEFDCPEYTEPSWYSSSEVFFLRCNKCRNYYFMNEYLGWQCRVCGHHDGDNTGEWLLRGNGELVYELTDTNSPICRAISAFKSARFEHGQTPQDLKKRK